MARERTQYLRRPRARRRALPRPDARGLRSFTYTEAPRPRAAVEVCDLGARARGTHTCRGPRGLPPVNLLLDYAYRLPKRNVNGAVKTLSKLEKKERRSGSWTKLYVPRTTSGLRDFVGTFHVA